MPTAPSTQCRASDRVGPEGSLRPDADLRQVDPERSQQCLGVAPLTQSRTNHPDDPTELAWERTHVAKKPRCHAVGRGQRDEQIFGADRDLTLPGCLACRNIQHVPC